MSLLEYTCEDARMGMQKLAPAIERYANLVVRKGVNVKPGQEVVVQSPVECAEFARLLAKRAYAAGAGHVTVIWGDDEVSRLTYENVETAWFENVPEWQKLQLNSLAEDGACFIFVEGADRLWCAILSVARADGEDPESDWELHDATFEKNLRLLNERRFKALHYRSDNGTDLTVGLPAGHLWAGGKCETPEGHPFFPNIPTEEVFTSPHCDQVNGVVYSALPLVRHGNKIDRFWLRFENGRVVDFDAAIGKDTLASILDTDEGARRLGEVALISKNTPIRESEILFYDTLYDENASCHLALGVGFPECYEGGYEMSSDELRDAGVNTSATHVDFMIGTDDMDITGICEDGTEVPIFVNGQWAWE